MAGQSSIGPRGSRRQPPPIAKASTGAAASPTLVCLIENAAKSANQTTIKDCRPGLSCTLVNAQRKNVAVSSEGSSNITCDKASCTMGRASITTPAPPITSDGTCNRRTRTQNMVISPAPISKFKARADSRPGGNTNHHTP